MSQLNPQQLAAVRRIDTPLLVLAGAGSGKTRVITEKIAHLIDQGTPAKHIAAVTFTNKAAREMKSRVGKLVEDKSARGLTVCTFHALGLEIIRQEFSSLGFKKNISIFDEHDRLALLKELIKHGQDQWDINLAEYYAKRISHWKNKFLVPHNVLSTEPLTQPSEITLYEEYQRHMKSFNAVDFDDLILQPVILFQDQKGVLEKWQNKIRYLLVDEYQDTNLTQYQLVKLLAGNLGRFTVVGDDDQSIYSWRGAQPENLAQLQKDFPRLEVIKLEQNYRSTRRVLAAANHLIANNNHVFEKRLWSDLGQGNPIRVLHHKDELLESRQIASDLVHHKFRNGTKHKDYAILYRGNHQSRLFETSLREAGVPYSLSGGKSFFSHSEIKDVMAYLRLITNHQDDTAFLRIVNIPRREIGPNTLEKLGAYANQRHISLFNACDELGLETHIQQNAIQRLRVFCKKIQDLSHRVENGDLFAPIEEFLLDIGYESWLHETSNSEGAAKRRIEQVGELIEWLKRIAANPEQPMTSLSDVIAKVMLIDILDRGQENEGGDQVNLMTLHASKGLEFPFVYLVGMEENLLPHESSIAENSIEEERRLAYVGITRARKELTLSYCTHRKKHGELQIRKPSRFLEELPQDDLEWAAKKEIDPAIKKERGQASLSQLRNLLKDS